MCQDSREAVSEKVCVNVHEHVSVRVLYVYMHAICLCACFVFNLCGLGETFMRKPSSFGVALGCEM